MAIQNPEQEPSIEEILSSIRQIISDDEAQETPASAPPPKKEEAPEPPPPRDDVIELTNKIEDDFSAAPDDGHDEAPIEVEMQEATEDVFEEIEEFEPEPEPPPPPPPPRARPEPPRRSEPEQMEATDDSSGLFTNRAENAALKGFSELARKTAVEYNGITLEEIVRTELQPMLRDWLDRHLPSMIERLVQEELERVSKRVLED